MLWRKLLRYQRVRVRQWIPQNLWYLLGRRNHHQHHRSVPCFADTWRWSFSWVPGAEVASSDGDQHRLAPSAWLHPRIELGRVRPDQDINSGYYTCYRIVSESPFKRWDWGSHTWLSSSILTVTTDSSGKACLVCSSTIRMRLALITHWSHQRRSDGVVRKIRLKKGRWQILQSQKHWRQSTSLGRVRSSRD